MAVEYHVRRRGFFGKSLSSPQRVSETERQCRHQLDKTTWPAASSQALLLGTLVLAWWAVEQWPPTQDCLFQRHRLPLNNGVLETVDTKYPVYQKWRPVLRSRYDITLSGTNWPLAGKLTAWDLFSPENGISFGWDGIFILTKIEIFFRYEYAFLAHGNSAKALSKSIQIVWFTTIEL